MSQATAAVRAAAPARIAPVARPASLAVGREGALVFLGALAVYLFMVWLVVFHLNIFVTDAMSRTLHAWQVFFSNDPKLTSVGFIWAPLPTLLQLPLVLLPPLRVNGLSGNVLTALMGALTCLGVREGLEALGVGRKLRLLMVGLFAVNPLILFYAANGMSEMTAVAFTVWSVAFLIRWTQTEEGLWLILSAFSLGLACLARYDSLVQAALMVLLVPYLRGSRGTRPAERQALTVAYLTPVVAAFGLWVLMNWLIMGDPIYFARGDYSNAAQIGYQMALLPEIGRLAGNPGAIAGFLVREISLLFPGFSVGLVAAAAVALARRDAQQRLGLALVALALTFPAFQALNFFAAQSAAFLRYFILAIPFGVLLLGYALAPAHRAARGPAILAALALVAASNVATGVAMQRSNEWGQWNDIFVRALITNTPERTWAVEREIAAYLAENHQGRDILVDDFQGYRIMFFTGHPEWFIATGDQDFPAKLQNPVAGNVRYILASSPRLEGVLNRVNIAYPTLFQNGAPWATLERDWSNADPVGSTWRLYRVAAPAASR